MLNRSLIFAVSPVFALLMACSTIKTEPSFPIANAKYVAMGSSFAAGPGVTNVAEGSPQRCGRSSDNYAHQIARRFELDLVDVSCSGAKTADILEASETLPAQIEAVSADTQLVTITIGGNDLGYIGGLMAASCAEHEITSPNSGARKCWPIAEAPSEADYKKTEASMMEIAQQIKQRAPNAVLIFVDYATVIPDNDICTVAPLSDDAAQSARNIARNLEAITDRVATNSNALIIKASVLTKQHNTCSAIPWMRGYPDPNWTFSTLPYHPTLESMTAIADAIEQTILQGQTKALGKP